MPLIKPTVGRIVWFYPSRNENDIKPEPQAAIVTRVWGDNCVNLTVFSPGGTPLAESSVRLVQDGDPPELNRHCEWMPYQKGQAAKTEALGKQAEQPTK
jgi:hypothetical protein